jgi:RNA polymerase sigma-54 factor
LDLLKNYYDDFTHKRFDNILRKSGISKDYLDRLTDIIQKLNPVPALSTPGADYIIPDFIVVKTDGGFKAELYRDYIPDIRINRVYKKMLDSDSTDHETKAFLKKRIENANLFLQALKNRKQTLIKVMDAILKRQREFFMTGGIVLNPMTEKDIASDVNTDISTVSRAVRNKYVQTDFGIFELRSFFSRSLSTSSGEDVSNVLLKRKLKELIDSEDKAKPLSDDKLAKLINQYGYTVARRTVTKYREELKIPKATLRRKIVL